VILTFWSLKVIFLMKVPRLGCSKIQRFDPFSYLSLPKKLPTSTLIWLGSCLNILCTEKQIYIFYILYLLNYIVHETVSNLGKNVSSQQFHVIINNFTSIVKLFNKVTMSGFQCLISFETTSVERNNFLRFFLDDILNENWKFVQWQQTQALDWFSRRHFKTFNNIRISISFCFRNSFCQAKQFPEILFAIKFWAKQWILIFQCFFLDDKH
jgi:hypothetical protein